MLVVLNRRVTPVENLYAALPMFLYYNATLLKPLLIPLLEQQSKLDQFPYASKDLGMRHLYHQWPVSLSRPIGAAFPTVSGPNLLELEAVERKFASPS